MEQLKQLTQQNRKEDANEINKLSLELYNSNKNDVNLLKVVIISSLCLGKDVSEYEDQMIKNGMNYELALHYYMKEEYGKALEKLGNEERDKVLKAQIYQKQEKYSDAAELYADVLQTTKESKTGLLTNLAACMIQDKSIDPKLLGTKTSDFVTETYGNAAIVMLRKGEITRAENYFNKALGSSALSDVELGDEKIEKFEDENKERLMKKRKEKRQRRRQKKMIKKHGKKDPSTLDPERWVPMHLRKKTKKSDKK